MVRAVVGTSDEEEGVRRRGREEVEYEVRRSVRWRGRLGRVSRGWMSGWGKDWGLGVAEGAGDLAIAMVDLTAASLGT